MKNLVLFIIVSLLISTGCAQDNNRYFSYKVMESGNYYLEPFESKFSPDNYKDGILHIDQNYFNKTFCPLFNKCFSKSQIDYLSSRNIYSSVYFDTSGNLLHIKFRIKKEMMKVITEKDLHKLYKAIKQTKLDPLSWGTVDYSKRNKDEIDYFRIMFPIISPQCKDYINRE